MPYLYLGKYIIHWYLLLTRTRMARVTTKLAYIENARIFCYVLKDSRCWAKFKEGLGQFFLVVLWRQQRKMCYNWSIESGCCGNFFTMTQVGWISYLKKCIFFLFEALHLEIWRTSKRAFMIRDIHSINIYIRKL